MQKILVGMLLAMFVFATAHAKDEPAAAPAPVKQRTAQQQRMADCNKEAASKQLKGEDRKKFMSGCLSNKPVEQKPAQQDKMKNCNQAAAAKQLKGEDRKKFMSECLSNKK